MFVFLFVVVVGVFFALIFGFSDGFHCFHFHFYFGSCLYSYFLYSFMKQVFPGRFFLTNIFSVLVIATFSSLVLACVDLIFTSILPPPCSLYVVKSPHMCPVFRCHTIFCFILVIIFLLCLVFGQG